MMDARGGFAEAEASPDFAVVGPVDSRLHETRTREFPWNTVCHLGRDFGDGLWRGCSGALIGPRRVLTAGHCLFSLRLGRPPQRVRVAPGRTDRARLPYGAQLAIAGYVPRRFVHAASAAERRVNDYGVLLLARPFAGIRRPLSLRVLSDGDLSRLRSSDALTVAGYPADRPVGTMWRHSERLRRYSPELLLYTVDTCPGHSGSPIWAATAGEPVVIGIHTSGILDGQGRPYGCGLGTVLAPGGLSNTGVRVTAEVAENLRNPERRSAGASPMLRVL